MPAAAALRINSSLPSFSGAMVISRTREGSSAMFSRSSQLGFRKNSFLWAPAFPSLRNGASICAPSTLAPLRSGCSITFRIPSITLAVSSMDALMVVGQNAPVPVPASSRLIRRISVSPRMVSLPRNACIWTSTKPGSRKSPSRSITFSPASARRPSPTSCTMPFISRMLSPFSNSVPVNMVPFSISMMYWFLSPGIAQSTPLSSTAGI